jgi:hypothetical protein
LPLLLQLNCHIMLLLGTLLLQLDRHLMLLLGPLQLNSLLPKGNPHLLLLLLASLMLHMLRLPLSLLSPPLPKPQMPSHITTMKILTDTWPHLALVLLVIMLLVVLLVKMPTMSTIVGCKSSMCWHQVILKAMLYSLIIVMGLIGEL